MELIGWLIALVVALVAGGAGGAYVLDSRYRRDREREMNDAAQRVKEVNDEIHEIDRRGMGDNDRINAKVDAILRARERGCAGRRKDDPKP